MARLAPGWQARRLKKRSWSNRLDSRLKVEIRDKIREPGRRKTVCFYVPRPLPLLATVAIAAILDCSLPRRLDAQDAPRAGQRWTFQVKGTEREAIVHRRSQSGAGPAVLVFHGFMGRARQAEFSYRIHEEWPDATVVYPQGLPVRLGAVTAPGWQIGPEMQEGRDLAFFDSILARLEAEKLSNGRVYVCGMSNGAIFSYLLASQRSAKVSGLAAVGGYAPPVYRGTGPIPALIVHGQQDRVIRFELAERSRDVALANNRCEGPSHKSASGQEVYRPKAGGAAVVWSPHEGGHIWPEGTTEAIVRFFRGL